MITARFHVVDNASVPLKELVARCDPHVIATRIAPPLAEYQRDHLARLPKNKHGYPSTGFWEQAARATNGIADGPKAIVQTNKLGVSQRWHGGPIEAVNVKYLTIPISKLSYGKTVLDFDPESLVLVILGDGRKFLCLWEGDKKPKLIMFRQSTTTETAKLRQRSEKNLPITWLFKLQEKTRPQAPNPDVIPPDFGQRAQEEVRKAVAKDAK